MLERACKDAIDFVRDEVRIDGGEFVDSDGYGLRLGKKDVEVIKPVPAWPILSELGDDIEKVLSVGKGAYEKAIKAHSAKGEKGRDWLRTLDRLRAAGAMAKRPVETLELVQPAKQVTATQATIGEAS